MTRNHMAHPLLISLANISMDFRTKASNHLFLLLALLPIPCFLHKDQKTCGVLESQLFHQCLDIILAPLKKVAEIRAMMSDPVGNWHFCFTPLAAYIVDTPESALITGVGGKTSSITMAFYKQFGDDFQHEPRTASTILAQLLVIESKANPWNLDAYIAASANFQLNGVHRPFWLNYPLSDPSSFLTPEPLHHWHKQFWDHDAKWCINALGGSELDFWFCPSSSCRLSTFQRGDIFLKTSYWMRTSRCSVLYCFHDHRCNLSSSCHCYSFSSLFSLSCPSKSNHRRNLSQNFVFPSTIP